MGDNNFFFRVNKAKEIKSSILELSEDLALAMKRFEKLKKIRERKKELSQEVSKIFLEIENACTSMDFKAPEFGIEGISKKRGRKDENKAESNYSSISEDFEEISSDYDEEIEKIEKSTEEIEKKLDELL